MASPTTTAAISNLDDDILLSIFYTITFQTHFWWDHRPLTVIGVASQVCRRWRGLLLASPPIWGRLIDLDDKYGPKSMEWMEEVRRRAGSAPLWIFGHIRPREEAQSFDSESYFMRLLESWERIEKLSVTIYSREPKIFADIQRCFLRRAPILKLFGVRFFGLSSGLYLDSLQAVSSESLFADYAPSLQAMKTGQMAYRADSSWLRNVRQIDPFPFHFTLKDFFVSLQHSPLIERIGIDSRELVWPNKIQPPLPQLTLPHLSSMKVKTNLKVLTGILDHITPGRLSDLLFYVLDHDSVSLNDPTILSSFKNNLQLYISNYVKSNPFEIVTVSLTKMSFRICEVANSALDDFFYSFDISAMASRIVAPHIFDNLLACLLDAFIESLRGNPSVANSVTELRIAMRQVDVQPAILSKLYSFLRLFRHVQDIEIDELYGPALLALSSLDEAGSHPQHIIFPQLRTLHLTSTDHRDVVDNDDLTSFLIRRKNIGFPVAQFDLTNCRGSIYAQDLRHLEAVGGLEVIWTTGGNEGKGEEKVCSYFCGTGDPERLKNDINIPLPRRFGQW